MLRREFLGTAATGPLLGAANAPPRPPVLLKRPLDLFTRRFEFDGPPVGRRLLELRERDKLVFPAPVRPEEWNNEPQWVFIGGFGATNEEVRADRERKLNELAAKLISFDPRYDHPFILHGGVDRTPEAKAQGFRGMLGKDTQIVHYEGKVYACGRPGTLVFTMRCDHRVRAFFQYPVGNVRRYHWLMECSMVAIDRDPLGYA